MAMGKLSSLGAGSSVLTSDVIDKLRKADEGAMIAPTDRKIKENIEKQTELISIMSMLEGASNSSKKLADYSTYMGRLANVVGDNVKASVAPGVPIQDINVEVKNIAKNDVNEVGTKFESRESVFSKKDTVLKFNTQGRDYKIDIKAGMTLQDVAQAITDRSNGNALGIIMKTGGANPYQLMINSKETGEGNRIYFGSVLQSEKIASGSITLGQGDMDVVLKDRNGVDQTLSIEIGATDANSKANDNAVVIREAIKEAIKQNSELSELLDSDINVGLSKDGNSIVINDRRGYAINIVGQKSKSIGFKKDQSDVDDLVHSLRKIPAGQLEGSFSINSIPLDLKNLTSSDNTAEQNAHIIAEAIDNIAGVYAYVDEKGKLVVNSDSGELNISDGSNGVLETLGLKKGVSMEYNKTQEDIFKFKNIQTGSDANIVFNGTNITRSSNTINDILTGLTLNLISPTDEGKPNVVNITADDESIIEDVKGFVEKYNELIPKLNEVTRFDPETKIAGIFNGVSFIRMIKPTLNKIFSAVHGSGKDTQSLVKYGISIDDNTKMSFDESKLRNALNTDPDKVRDFFVGTDKTVMGRNIRSGGVFKQLDDDLDSLIKGKNASLKLYEQTLTRDDKRLKEDRRKSMERLDSRYESMSQRFASFDEQIAKTNNSFGSLQMMINQATKGK